MPPLPLPHILPLGPRPALRIKLQRRGRSPAKVISPFYRGRTQPFTLHRPRRSTLLVRWKGVGDFLIERRGRRIVAQPRSDVPRERVRELLLSAIASFALLERGVEALHASSVVRGGRAVAFLGEPEAGKSTLAAFFARHGYHLLSDDLLAVERRGRAVFAYPSLPEVKLSPTAARALGLALRRLPRVEPGKAKRIWRAPAAQRPQPLAALYFLTLSQRRRSRVRLQPLPRRAAFRGLLSCVYNATLLTRGRLGRQFSLFAHLARTVPARRLVIPRRWEGLEEAVRRIEQDLRSLAR